MPDFYSRCDKSLLWWVWLQLVRAPIVALGVVGSSPIIHPKMNLNLGGRGEIGTRARLGSSGFSLGVQVPPPAPFEISCVRNMAQW